MTDFCLAHDHSLIPAAGGRRISAARRRIQDVVLMVLAFTSSWAVFLGGIYGFASLF